MNVLETARLNLRTLRAADAPFIVELLNEPGFLRHIGDKGVRTLPDARAYLEHGPMDSYQRFGFGLYRVSLRADDLPIGICGLVKRDTLPDVDLGFAFLEQHWGRGYASESAAAVLEYGRRTLQLRRILAIASPDNAGSTAVLVKIGLHVLRRVTLTIDSAPVNLFGGPSEALDAPDPPAVSPPRGLCPRSESV